MEIVWWHSYAILSRVARSQQLTWLYLIIGAENSRVQVPNYTRNATTLRLSHFMLFERGYVRNALSAGVQRRRLWRAAYLESSMQFFWRFWNGLPLPNCEVSLVAYLRFNESFAILQVFRRSQVEILLQRHGPRRISGDWRRHQLHGSLFFPLSVFIFSSPSSIL